MFLLGLLPWLRHGYIISGELIRNDPETSISCGHGVQLYKEVKHPSNTFDPFIVRVDKNKLVPAPTFVIMLIR